MLDLNDRVRLCACAHAYLRACVRYTFETCTRKGNVVTWAEAAEESRSKPRYVYQCIWAAVKISAESSSVYLTVICNYESQRMSEEDNVVRR